MIINKTNPKTNKPTNRNKEYKSKKKKPLQESNNNDKNKPQKK